MPIRPDTRRLPTLRNILTRIYSDLFTIDDRLRWHDPVDPLLPVEKMILILEDRRFFRHNGVDLRSLCREIVRAVLIQPHGGASTIDMQFVRTATGFREKTFKRKAYEIILALLIQFRYNKIEILRSYLDCAFFGSRLFGIQAICRREYQKLPSELSFDEAAETAAMLVYPRPLLPTPEWRLKVRRRANYGKRMYPRFEKTFNKLPRWKMF